MDSNDFARFTALMISWGKICPGAGPDEDQIEMTFRICENMPFEVIEKNGMQTIRTTGFFPKINDLRGEGKTNRQAMEDYEYLSHLLDVFYQPELGRSSMDVIEYKLERAGKKYLVGFLNRHGMEMVFGENPTATRAQLIKQLDIEIERHADDLKQIGRADQKQIPEMSDGGRNYPDLAGVLAKIGKPVE
jgi:hypothetical protein